MNKKGATKIGMFLSLLVALTAIIGLGPMVAGAADKELLCHLPANGGPTHTIAVGANAVDSHLAHFDTLGACGSEGVNVEICHVPPGNPDNAHTITVSDNALPAHLAHGDTEGACGAVTAVCPCAGLTTTSSNVYGSGAIAGECVLFPGEEFCFKTDTTTGDLSEAFFVESFGFGSCTASSPDPFGRIDLFDRLIETIEEFEACKAILLS